LSAPPLVGPSAAALPSLLSAPTLL
jgi:hypothetical protein